MAGKRLANSERLPTNFCLKGSPAARPKPELAANIEMGYVLGVVLTDPLPRMLLEARRARLPEAPVLAQAERWFEHCRMLRDFENQYLLINPASEDLRAHRVVIADLIADGAILAWQARQSTADLATADFTVEDIEAETRLLRGNARMFHEPPNTGASV